MNRFLLLGVISLLFLHTGCGDDSRLRESPLYGQMQELKMMAEAEPDHYDILIDLARVCEQIYKMQDLKSFTRSKYRSLALKTYGKAIQADSRRYEAFLGRALLTFHPKLSSRKSMADLDEAIRLAPDPRARYETLVVRLLFMQAQNRQQDARALVEDLVRTTEDWLRGLLDKADYYDLSEEQFFELVDVFGKWKQFQKLTGAAGGADYDERIQKLVAREPYQSYYQDAGQTERKEA